MNPKACFVNSQCRIARGDAKSLVLYAQINVSAETLDFITCFNMKLDSKTCEKAE